MPKIKTTCYLCGDVTVPDSDMTLTIYTCGPERSAEYGFECPNCGEAVVRPADDEAINLIEPYVNVIREKIPAEMREHPIGLPPINHDDVLDFVLLLPNLVARFD
jgi:hypothetical protein